MTGPEHYRAAEKLLACTERDGSNELNPQFLAQAQVHAVLALAAATAGCHHPPGLETAGAWKDIVGRR